MGSLWAPDSSVSCSAKTKSSMLNTLCGMLENLRAFVASQRELRKSWLASRSSSWRLVHSHPLSFTPPSSTNFNVQIHLLHPDWTVMTFLFVLCWLSWLCLIAEPLSKQIIVSRPCNFLASLRPGRPAWSTLASTLRTLLLQVDSVQWRRVYGSSEAKFLRDLPGFHLLWIRMSYHTRILDSSASEGAIRWGQIQPQARLAFLCPTGQNNTIDPVQNFSTILSQVGPFIKAHQVGGVPLCPALIYLEIVIQGVISHDPQADGQAKVSSFENVSFEHPLVYSTEREFEQDCNFQTELHTKHAEAMEFSSTSGSDDSLYCDEVRGVVAGSQTVADILARRQARVERLKQSLCLNFGPSAESFSSNTIGWSSPVWSSTTIPLWLCTS